MYWHALVGLNMQYIFLQRFELPRGKRAETSDDFLLFAQLRLVSDIEMCFRDFSLEGAGGGENLSCDCAADVFLVY